MLNKCVINFIFIYFGVFSNILIANELDTLSETEKKYEISICAIFKDEAYFLKDWIEYHLNIGVDHFYLYNIGSSDHYEKVLKTYIKKNVVTLMNWPEAITYHDENASKWALSTQIPAYENAVNFMARDETQWLVFLDINEFLVLPIGNIKTILKRYCEFPGIAFYSEFYYKKISKMLNENALRNDPSDGLNFYFDNIDKAVAKMIFKPDQCLGFKWPPYQCRFKEFVSCIEADPRELRAKCCVNRNIDRKFSEKIIESKEEIPHPILSKEMNEQYNKSIYHQIPDFLRKLKCSLKSETLE